MVRLYSSAESDSIYVLYSLMEKKYHFGSSVSVTEGGVRSRGYITIITSADSYNKYKDKESYESREDFVIFKI